MRNPKWYRDEVILTLDLYFRLDSGRMNASSPEIVELSELLNILPRHPIRPDYQKFRNPNGVALKLGNFKFFDPDYQGVGLQGGSKLDKEVFDEFYGKQNELRKIADNIRSTTGYRSLNEALFEVNDESEDSITAKEGLVIFKLHKLRERNPLLTRKKKSLYLKNFGKLDCEVCGFDFFKKYGPLGEGYIEAHHRIPLSDLNGETLTSLEDLALVCSNCHKMLHRGINTMSIETLKTVISKSALT